MAKNSTWAHSAARHLSIQSTIPVVRRDEIGIPLVIEDDPFVVNGIGTTATTSEDDDEDNYEDVSPSEL